MANNTYVALNKTTITGTSVPSVTFTGISGSYTDLVLICTATTALDDQFLTLQFNGDTASNYSTTYMTGDGSGSATTGRNTSTLYIAGSSSNTTPVLSITHIQNYSNSTGFKSILSRTNDPSLFSQAISGLWNKTPEPITSMVIASNGNISVGSTFALYGIRAEGVSPTTKATGGAVYSDSTYYYHVFGASGTFTPTQSITADCLVVAGGAGGGRSGGGGGAGGLLAFTGQSLTATGYTVTVGSGGAGNNTDGQTGTLGGDSQFGALTLVKGGGGGGSYGANGATGGSGGGGGGFEGTARTGGSATSGQGNIGGNGFAGSSSLNRAGGGGGGAGGTGSAAASALGGNGGIGLSTYSSWGVATGVGQNVSGTYYLSGGGGGYAATGGSGGLGGGGGKGVNGTANTGGGGGGSASDGTVGFNGGAGVVIVRYAK
jgi:hypothetical protein